MYANLETALAVWFWRMVRGVMYEDTGIFMPFGIDKFVRSQPVQVLESFGEVLGP